MSQIKITTEDVFSIFLNLFVACLELYVQFDELLLVQYAFGTVVQEGIVPLDDLVALEWCVGLQELQVFFGQIRFRFGLMITHFFS